MRAGLRPDLRPIVDELVSASEATGDVALDAIGEAIGARAVSAEDVEAILDALEARGRRVVGPEGGGGEARLKKVLDTARALFAESGRRPGIDAIAARSGLSREEIETALALARVMQR